jgi:hypothetical protein
VIGHFVCATDKPSKLPGQIHYPRNISTTPGTASPEVLRDQLQQTSLTAPLLQKQHQEQHEELPRLHEQLKKLRNIFIAPEQLQQQHEEPHAHEQLHELRNNSTAP